LEIPSRFLTQKELDPDAVAFNSNNNRYNFPARFFLPFSCENLLQGNPASPSEVRQIVSLGVGEGSQHTP
jgi:hypothetical protein